MIRLLSKTTQTVNHYYFDVENENITVIEYVNSRGKVIDSIVESANGYITDDDLIEQLYSIINEIHN